MTDVEKLRGVPSEAALIWSVIDAAKKHGYLFAEELISWRKGLLTDRVLLTRVRDRILKAHQEGRFEGAPKIPAWAINRHLLQLRDTYGSLE